MNKRLNVFFKGTVQGVGFRYAAVSIANRLNINGWVKNLHNGEVEILAEGQEKALQELLNGLDEEFGGYISDKKIEWEEPTSEFKDFDIRFD